MRETACGKRVPRGLYPYTHVKVELLTYVRSSNFLPFALKGRRKRGELLQKRNRKHMVTTKTVVAKASALAIIPSLTLGLFAVPALAFGGPSGVTTLVDVANVNTAVVVNAVKVKADTGSNVADGGNGAQGGKSGTSGSNAGDGGDGGEGGNGGDADANGGNTYAAGGNGGFGFDGGKGGDTGNTGKGGNGGNGGEGGDILTGNAAAAAYISNEVNTNKTNVTVEDCGCEQYNEKYEAANSFYEAWEKENKNDDRRKSRGNSRAHKGQGGSEEESYEAGASSWEKYSKTFVPVTTAIRVVNANDAAVANGVEVEAETGDNAADGGNGGKGGASGNSGSNAGDGGNGGQGGNGGDADAENKSTDSKYGKYSFGKKGGSSTGPAAAEGGDAGDGGFGATGGDTGDTGKAGNGGDGARGGVIVTGSADALAAVVNVVNRNVTRITR